MGDYRKYKYGENSIILLSKTFLGSSFYSFYFLLIAHFVSNWLFLLFLPRSC